MRKTRTILSLSVAVAAALAVFAGDLSIHKNTKTVNLVPTVDYNMFTQAEAKFRSSGFSSSRSFSYSRSSSSRSSSSLWNRSSSSSSSGYKKPAASAPKATAPKATAPKATAPKATQQSMGYSKKGSTPDTARRSLGANKNSAAVAVQRKQASAAITKHRSNTSKFAKPATSTVTTASSYKSNPIYSRNKPVDMNTYYSRRDNFYGGRNWSTPNYVYMSQPSFGMWDAMFMWYMLDSINDAQYRNTYYHHQSSAGMQEWRREADRLAADNAELKAKLASLDAEMGKLSAQGVVQDPNYAPEGVDAGVMLAAEAATGSGDLTVRMGTGGVSGNYFAFCNAIRTQASGTVPVKCENTDGSVANLDGLVAGKYDAIMVQSDVYNEWLRENPGKRVDGLQASVYPEVVFLIANQSAGVDSIKDIDTNKHRIYVAGSGARKSLVGFARQDKGYMPLLSKATQVTPGTESLQMLANNPNGVMFYVCGLRCGLLEKANTQFGGKLDLAAVDDWNFNDARDQYGEHIYNFVDIPTTYKNLQPSGWLSSGAVETLAVQAVLIVSKDWVESKGVAGLSKLEAAIWPAMAEIQKRVGVPD